MSNNRECADYFRGQKAYDRCFAALWKKWRSYGRTAGQIILPHTSEEERKAIGGIIGKTFFTEKIQFSFAEFETGLQKTRFAPVDIQQVLEEYFGKKLQTSLEEQKEKEKQKQDFLEDALKYFIKETGCDSVSVKWLKAVMTEKKYGYQILIREYGKSPEQAEILLKTTGTALWKLEEFERKALEWPLAVFAADLSENPHYFDRGSIGGMLLVHGICFMEGEKLPESAHGWRELLQSAGIVPDSISSFVHVYGLHLKMEEGWHPAYEAFCQRKEPYVITLENMREIVEVEASLDHTAGNGSEKRVYIVENEMVFTYLLNHLQNPFSTVLCTSGQLRSVSMQLIPMLLKSGAQVYYSGDIDPDGIRIADHLWQKFGEGIHIWRMSLKDYEKSCSMEKIGKSGLSKLENIHHPELKKTAEAVKKKRLAGYQENILQELLQDIL